MAETVFKTWAKVIWEGGVWRMECEVTPGRPGAYGMDADTEADAIAEASWLTDIPTDDIGVEYIGG